MNKIILWDFDGTLGYREGNWEGAILELTSDRIRNQKANLNLVLEMTQSGFPWHKPQKSYININNSHDWWEYVKPKFIEIFTVLGYSKYEAQIKSSQVPKQYAKLEKWKLYNDVISNLSKLLNHKWKNILVTNNIPEFPMILKHLKLESYFDAIFVSAITGFNKPNPLILNGYLDKLQDFSKIIVVGDRDDSDMELAKVIKAEGILVHTTLASQSPKYDNLNDLTKYLLSLNYE